MSKRRNMSKRKSRKKGRGGGGHGANVCGLPKACGRRHGQTNSLRTLIPHTMSGTVGSST